MLNLENAKFDEPVGKLTLREAFEWYIQPAMDRAEEIKRATKGETTSGRPQKVFEPQTEEEALMALAMLGVKVPKKESNG